MVQTQQKTECSFIPIVISKYTARVHMWRNRVPQGALERLELLDAKVSRAVLRGRAGGNTAPLLDTFATLSNGEEIANPRFLRNEERALAKVQRKHARLKKGTKERRRHRKVIARVHERTKWRRDNFTHQHSRKIVNTFGTICVEDLHVKRMVHNHCLAKSLSDAAWSQFFEHLSCKAEDAGRTLLKVNPAHTTQDCSRCHHRQKMPLRVRTSHCPCCFLVIDRDLNAAINIVGLGLQSRVIPEAPGL